jgi:glucose/arabinose dehydrogenase
MLGSLTRHRMVPVVALALFAGLLPIFVLGKPVSGAATVPNGFQDSEFATGLEQVTAMEFAPDGSKRLFVTEKDAGNIRVIKWNEDGTGTLLQEPFAHIPNVDTRQTRGLLGITFHPSFGKGTNEDYVYAHYTQEVDGESHNRIVRFEEAKNADGTPADVATKNADGTSKLEPIFELDKLGTATTHDGGHIDFGNDGYLYVPVGDNKRNKLPPILNTMKLNNLFGKVLRINADGSIPTDNPFLDETTGKNQAIYARGFRNPFSTAVEPAPGNRIYINDVGEQTWEEINDLKAGANYGWPKYEGFEGDRRFKKPVFAYKHDSLPRTPPETSGCSISGGTFYYPPGGTSTPFPEEEYQGDYFFADFCNGWIRKLDVDGDDSEKVSGFASGASLPVDLKIGPDGGLYYLEWGSGSVRVIRPSPDG